MGIEIICNEEDENMRKYFFKYEIDKILWSLSGILIISIYIIICDCELPLVEIHPEVDIYLEYIFVHKHKDKTFYNIAISYLSAYIFFVLQVYIPSKLNHKKSLMLLREEIEKYMEYVKLLLLMLSEVTILDDNEVRINRKKSKIYIIEETKNQIFCITFKKSVKKMLDLIQERQNRILTSPMLNSLDKRMCELLCSIPLQDLVFLSNNIYEQLQNTKIVPIKSGSCIRQARDSIHYLEKEYGFILEQYGATEDPHKISEYCTIRQLDE